VLQPQLWFSPKGGEVINETMIDSLSIKHSIYDAIPTASVTISDKGGTQLGEFVMPYGSFFETVIVDYGSKDAQLKPDGKYKSNPHTSEGYDPAAYVKVHDWTLIGAIDDSSIDVKMIQGKLTYIFAHPWFVYRDVLNHAYPPMRTDELVKKVLKEGVRGYPLLDPIDGNFNKTDDEGRVPRYKVQTTDLEFIVDDLMPITSIGYDAPYFFTDTWGYQHLRSFGSMIAESPKIIFAPKTTDIQDNEVKKRLYEMISSNGITEDGYVETMERTVAMYAPDKKEAFSKEVKPAFIVEDINVAKTYALGNRDPGTKMPGETGRFFPMTLMSRQLLQGTSVKVRNHRLLGDSISSVFADNKVLNECFVMEIVSKFTGQYGLPGMTALVYVFKLDMLDLNTGTHYNADHWAEGKWLIAETEHFMTPGDHTVYTRTKLIRPTLVIKDAEKSSISIINSLWSIEV
jgi:hypothetical protein